MRAAALVVVLVVLGIGGCRADDAQDAGGTTTSSTSSSTSTSTSEVARFETCTAEADGYRVDYPRGWHTNDTRQVEPCRLFHPGPFEPAPATEATDVAIVLRFTSASFEAIVRDTLRAPAGAVIEDDERRTIDGRAAVRIRARATGEARLPAGTRSVRWFVDFGSRTLVGTTLSVAGAAFERNVEVLDHMMRSMARVEASGAGEGCSAAGLSPEPVDQPELPEPVRNLRDRIVRAAVACDFEELEALALAGGPFTYSFGAEGDPGGHWRRQEQGPGPAPLRFLVGLLDRPFRTVEHAHRGELRYVWPSAFGYDSWEAVPHEEKEALRPLYTEQDFEDFARFGGYVGYRVAITADGNWEFFVAGD